MNRCRYWFCLVALIVWPYGICAQSTQTPPIVPPSSEINNRLTAKPTVEQIPPAPPQSTPTDSRKATRYSVPDPRPRMQSKNSARIMTIYVEPTNQRSHKTQKIPMPEPTPSQTPADFQKTTNTSQSPQSANVRLEWVGPKLIRVGRPTAYEIVLKNRSQSTAHNVKVEHLAPKNVQFFTSKLRPTQKNGKFTWNVGTLEPNQEYRIPAKFLVSHQQKKQYSLRATVTCTTVSELRVSVYRPKLKLAIRSPKKGAVGVPVPVQITVENTGDGPADAVEFVAELPEGFEHPSGSKIAINLGTIQAQEKRAMQLVCTPRQAKTYTITAQALSGDDLRAEASTTTTVASSDLRLVVSGPTKQYIQRNATYTLQVTHPGGTPASGVVIQSKLPTGFQFVRATDGGQYQSDHRIVSWYLGDMTPGQTRQVKLTALPVETGALSHQAIVQTANGSVTKANTTTQVVGISALLVELTDVGDPVEVSKETVYEIRVTNTGSKTEANLTLVCTIPKGMEFRAADCAAHVQYQQLGNQILFAPVLQLAPRADVLYRVRLLGRTPGVKVFRAQVQANGLSRPVVDEESTTVFGDDELP